MSSDPYCSPDSNLGQPNDVLKYSIVWKIYFFFIISLSGLGVFGLYFYPGYGLAEVFDTIFLIPASVGFFGFVFRKRILKPEFWNVFFVTYVAWTVLYFFITDIDSSDGLSDIENIVSTVIVIMISIPFYVGLFYYGRATYPIWQKESQQDNLK